MTFSAYHNTEAFYQVVRSVKKWNSSELTPKDKKIGKVKYTGQIKLHGSNAGIFFSKSGEIIPQSRSKELSIQNDNAGFAAFCLKNLTSLMWLEDRIRREFVEIGLNDFFVYGEWIGKGIQKGVAINQLPSKQLVIFAIKIVGQDEQSNYYLDRLPSLKDEFAEQGIFSIIDCKTWELEVDFQDEDSLKRAIEFAEEKTKEVEQCCPWAKKFGIEGLGEGIVWKPIGQINGYRKSDLMFKTKGEKHKVTNDKVKNKIEPEIINNINEFVDFSVTENRLNQGLDALKEQGYDLEDIKNTGHYIKWMSQDVLRECEAELVENGLIWKDVCGAVAKKSKDFYIDRLK